MPIHDWTRVTANDFHSFHNNWITMLQAALNGGLLPPGYYAQGEQVTSAGFNPDILTLAETDLKSEGSGGLLLATLPPKVKRHEKLDDGELLARKARQIAVRHNSGDRMVAVIEIVSRGNKRTKAGLRGFVKKSCRLISNGVHLMVLDLFPPGNFDPRGIHERIWNRLGGNYDATSADELTASSYRAGGLPEFYLEPLKVGAALVDMPLFLSRERYVNIPLEQTYLNAYQIVPAKMKRLLDRVDG